MVWYWYVARSNEIFCDLDSKRAVSRALNVLRRAIRKKMLDVEAVHFYPSLTNYHLIIVLKYEVTFLEKMEWALWMGSDRLRSVFVLARYERGSEAADILCTPKPWADGFRFMDDRCECKSKHKDKRVTDQCPAMKRLLGDERSGDYFPRNTDRKERTKPLKVPWGRVPKRLLLAY